ncbi:hypothetical protein CWB89_05225 [Pseudoalteromonas piscicida]|uniref:Uncharacterized protein n=1 Tax=Pseudoalteromonas piscicida TaxID=43662 RepID=A0AAQ2EWX5_PSEO7|nr:MULTISPECIES: hypothetical protein [Pseudoalteromonas]KJY89718.1 hypothetical protein TW75_09170 [Pseudoalteromonas piscicida]TMN36541.1 hypothetical protein CWB94_18735 [Pseudoalteromonas piscicida]TMN40067.1 hypothetical protein CWB95_11465 [Pseudoalteromonas piscicida]TMN54128.1 hypothetical protein CWB92_07295 [Pseudoalteromonas piscicida]TMN55912.1 hypothetical protein CWB93_11395 [Pseudoalteromonas piscicida]
MRAVEKHPSFVEHLFNDSRVRKYGMMVLVHGVKGATKKINLAALYVDAALSAFEAVNSYLKYAKECEKTKQILSENRKIKSQLDTQLKILKIKQDTNLKESQARIDELNRRIQLSQDQRTNLLTQIKKHLQIVKIMQKKLKEERENGVNFKQLQQAQQALDHLLRSSLLFITNNVE